MRATELLATRPATRLPQPVVIGHRGAPAYRPEHTAASYDLAIDLGAELIEPDVVVSRDGVLVVRHENELSLSTDVAHRSEFTDRRTTKLVDDQVCTGWFAEDFTIAELRTLRAVERMPALRPLNTAYDGHFGILTLAEVVELARRRSTPDRQIRVLAELKHAGWTDAQGLPVAELIAEELRRLEADDERGPVLLQAFESEVLRDLRIRLGARGPQMVQLVDDNPDGGRAARHLHLRPGGRPQPRARPHRPRAGRRGAPRRARRLLLDPAGGEPLPARAPAPRRGSREPRRRHRRRPPAAEPRRGRPHHRLPRPRRPRHSHRSPPGCTAARCRPPPELSR
jgi:glycerophosphoryl diester phosphodiesterase